VSSNVLLQDSVIGLEKFLMTLFAKAIAWFEEHAFLQGNGVGKPQGMLGCSAALPPAAPRWPALARLPFGKVRGQEQPMTQLFCQ
jgi:HK97 family phage major capsid protein